MKKQTTIFVSGSTDPTISKEYYDAAKKIGKMINDNNCTIVFDGCLGLPGVAAKQMKSQTNMKIAYCRNYLMPQEWKYATIRDFRHQSEVTRTLLEWSDMAVFLKGGSGTLAELFHAIDTKKNGEHSKQIIILNIDNQWNELIDLLETLGLQNLYHLVDSTEKVIQYMEKQMNLAKDDEAR